MNIKKNKRKNAKSLKTEASIYTKKLNFSNSLI